MVGGGLSNRLLHQRLWTCCDDRYGQHQAPELQKEAVYGLTEINRDEVHGESCTQHDMHAVVCNPRNVAIDATHNVAATTQIRAARLVANPGCYPTSVQLPLIPLLQAGLIASDDIVINSMSGVSGAGRSAKQNLLYTEIAESVNAYGITRHRHVPEIEQGLTEACGKEVMVSFTPNLMPMSRGMQSTCYVKMSQGASVDDLRASLAVGVHLCGVGPRVNHQPVVCAHRRYITGPV